MKLFCLFGFFSLFIFSSCLAQDPKGPDQEKAEPNHSKLKMSPDSNTIYKDENGKVIDQMSFMKKIQSGDYKMLPVINDGRISEMSLTPNKLFIKEKSPAPDFSLRSLKKEKIHLDELKGKVVVLNFWFIQCKPCVNEMSELNELVKEYSGNNKVVFVALTFDNKDAVTEFLKKQEFEYTIIPMAKTVTDAYGVNYFPTHVVIQPDGNIQKIISGYQPGVKDALKKEIDASLSVHKE